MLLISFLAFISVGLGSIGYFILLIGHILVVPLLVSLSNGLYKKVAKPVIPPATDVLFLVPKTTDVGNPQFFPSYWMGHITFFFGYLISNAVDLMNIESPKGVSEMMVDNRVLKAKTLIAVLSLMLVALVVLRYRLTGVETLPGVGLSLGTFLAGVLWYSFAGLCGARASDIFGVAQQMLPSSATAKAAITCAYNPAPPS
jgi:hypothetical protein